MNKLAWTWSTFDGTNSYIITPLQFPLQIQGMVCNVFGRDIVNALLHEHTSISFITLCHIPAISPSSCYIVHFRL